MPEPADTTSAGPRLLGPADVRSLAAALDLRPTKQRGQNFVIDANTVRRIVRESGVSARRRGDRGRPRPGLADPGAAGGRPPRGRRRGRPGPGRGAAGHHRDVRPGRGGAVRGGPRRRDAGHRDPRPAADRAGREPALQRLGAGAAAPARPAALARARPGDGAGRGRRPAGGAAGLEGLRRPVGQGRVVRRRTPRRRDRPQRLLAGARTSTPAWSPGPVASRRRPPPPASRSSRSSTRRSRTGARRCARRSRRWPAPRPPPRPRWRTPASTRWPAARCSGSQEFARIAEGLHLDD